MAKLAPKPVSRDDNAGLFARIKLFREDMFSSQPAKLYRAWMAETRAPFYRSFLINQPDLVRRVLVSEQPDFPKSSILQDSLRGLLGGSVFVTNGEVWERQRRIIDPAFAGSPKLSFDAMVQATEAAIERLEKQADGQVIEVEYITSYLAADVIFRTLFSIPITSDIATEVFTAFRDYQRSQPLWNLPSLLRLPSWVPKFHAKSTRQNSTKIRALLTRLVATRSAEIANGTAPDDLATRIMTTVDPVSGTSFSAEEMVDQVAIFFLAGHETSASALAWGLYLLADNPQVQTDLVSETAALDATPKLAQLSKLPLTRDVFRETLRLFPPVPMMVREAAKPTEMRGRKIPKRSLIILSPWHLHRHERLWERPDEFDPYRWKTENGKACKREAYLPFSTGPRVCTGAGFAMIEGVLLLAMLVRAFRFETDTPPIPVAHLTVRAKDGIHLRITPRVDAIPARKS